MAIKVAASMPPMTVVPRMRREAAPAPVAITSGTTPRMKAKAVMRIGRRRRRAPASAASTSGRAALVLGLRELDDQDGVLGGQPDEHHQADLREDVQFVAASHERGTAPRTAMGVPSSTPKGSDQLSYCAARMQEHDEQGQAEDGGRRDALRGHLLLERHAGVVEAHLARHGLGEDLLQRLHALLGADAGREDAVDLGRPVLVEAQGEVRAVDRFHGDQRRQGHRLVARRCARRTAPRCLASCGNPPRPARTPARRRPKSLK